MGEQKNMAPKNHRALYRKHRSKKLSEIIGQEHITKTLENALKQGKISHAYLFTGPRGTGKTSIARILAHEINNLPYEEESTHLDIIEIDAASNRRIDDIRDLRDKVHIAPISAKYKIYIIDEVHMLTTESFNALLKTLEEPPAHVIFILATTEVHKLPATIISRTQRHGFRLIEVEKVATHLKSIAKKENIKIDDDSLKILAEHGGGSFRDSISLLDQISSSTEPITTELVELLLGLAPKKTLTELLEHTLNGNGAQIIKTLDVLYRAGLTPPAIANQLIAHIRLDVLEGNHTAQTASLMSDLLLVQNSEYQRLKLESILLGVAPPAPVISRTAQETETETTTEPLRQNKVIDSEENDRTTDSVVQKPKHTDKHKPDLKESEEATKEDAALTKTAKPKETTNNTSVGDFSIQKHWPLILETTKKKNNPLYTVLRLATPEIEEKELLLIFSFPFHKKKLEEPKHKAVISEIITDLSGADISFRSIVDKQRAKPANASSVTPDDPAHASLISSVQDIMGGGEIINV